MSSSAPGDESSWGDFLTLADVHALHVWTGALLADHYRGEDPLAERVKELEDRRDRDDEYEAEQAELDRDY